MLDLEPNALWTSVSNPPELIDDGGAWLESAPMLIRQKDGFCTVARFTRYPDDDETGDDSSQWFQEGRGGYVCHPTHWMPLPPFPDPETDV